MRCSLFALFVILSLSAETCLAANAEVIPVARIDWNQLKAEGTLKSGEVIAGHDGQPARLRIENAAIGTTTLPLCEIPSPRVTTPSYAVRGTIRYEKVDGTGFLEMWSHFPDKGQYFTRTLDSSGPMGMVTGTSAERSFVLPFHTFGQAPAPTRLTINLVLNGPGTVEIGPLELIPIDSMSATGSDWWSASTGGLVGGIGGSLLGIIGAAMGILTGLGKGKKVVLALAVVIALLGGTLLVSGIVAIGIGQTYSVYYPLLLTGVMMLIAGSVCLCTVPNRYRNHELRRMQALDLS